MKFEDLPTREQKLEQWKKEHEAGDGTALFHAVAFCLNLGIDTPSWAITAFNAAWYIRYEGGESRTLDEAFNVSRPRGWQRTRASKDVLIFVAWQKVNELIRAPGAVIGPALFEEAAAQLNTENFDTRFNATDVQKAYYAVSALLKKK